AGRRAAARAAIAKEGRAEADWPTRLCQAPDRDRTGGEEGGRVGRARALEGASSGDRSPSAAGRRARRRDARALLDLDPRARKPRACTGSAPTGAGAARCGLRPARYVSEVWTFRKISASSAGGVTSSWS